MALSNLVNRKGVVQLLTGTIDWAAAGSTVKCTLLVQSYAPGAATFRDVHDYYDDVSAFAAASSIPMAVTLQAPQTGAGLVYLDPSTTSLTFTSCSANTNSVGGFVSWKSSATAASSPLITLNAFATPVFANGSDIQATFDANGFAKFSW